MKSPIIFKNNKRDSMVLSFRMWGDVLRETSSAQAPYPSLPRKRESSLISLRLLSESQPLRWVAIRGRLRRPFGEAYPSGPRKREPSLTPSRLLSKSNPLRWASIWGRLRRLFGKRIPRFRASAKARSFRCPSSPNHNHAAARPVVAPYGVTDRWCTGPPILHSYIKKTHAPGRGAHGKEGRG